jgi:hypothetical protein
MTDGLCPRRTPVLARDLAAITPVCVCSTADIVCKNPFVSPITNFPGCGRGDRILMWWTTSFCDEITGDSGGAFEAASIGDCRLSRRLAKN